MAEFDPSLKPCLGPLRSPLGLPLFLSGHAMGSPALLQELLALLRELVPGAGCAVRIPEAPSCCVVRWWERLCPLLHLRMGWVSLKSPKAEGKLTSVYIPPCAPFWSGFWVPEKTIIYVSKCKSAPLTCQALMLALLMGWNIINRRKKANKI